MKELLFEESSQRFPVRRPVPLVFQILCNVMFRNEVAPREMSDDRVEILCIQGVFGVILGNACNVDVEWVDLSMIWAVFERDDEVIVLPAPIAVMDVGCRNLIVIKGRLASDADQIAKKTELMPQRRRSVYSLDYCRRELTR